MCVCVLAHEAWSVYAVYSGHELPKFQPAAYGRVVFQWPLQVGLKGNQQDKTHPICEQAYSTVVQLQDRIREMEARMNALEADESVQLGLEKPNLEIVPPVRKRS